MYRSRYLPLRRAFHVSTRLSAPRNPSVLPPQRPLQHKFPSSTPQHPMPLPVEDQVFVATMPLRVSYARPLLFGACACTGVFLAAGIVYERQQETAWDRWKVRLRQKQRDVSGWFGRRGNVQGQQDVDELAPTLRDLWLEKKQMILEKRQAWMDRTYARLQRWQDVYGLPESIKRAGIMVAAKYASMSDAERTLAYLIGANCLVFGAWQVPRWTPFMSRWFLHHPGSGQSITLITSCFSHKEGLHLACNMIGLWSFGGLMHDYLGREQFLALYMTTGIGANMVSHTLSLALRNQRPLLPSLGASGAIYGLLSGTAYLQPNASIALVFLPMVPIKLGYALPAMMGFDVAGILLKWKMFDHFAHLAGACIGLGYLAYGHQHIWTPLIQKIYHQRRARQSSD